jgi:heavy metal sensor kinase
MVLGPLAVVGAAGAGYVIAGRALAPLSRMAERARTISADRLSERLPVENAQDELGQLATVFNETFARLEASFERLKRFTADASHQLRTPLTALRSVGEVGLREARSPGDYAETIGSMLEEADRLASLVDALLTLSRWESGRVARRPTSLDLGEIARGVASQLGVLAEDRRITLDVDVAPVVVSADEVMIRSAVMNVVDNAIKFTPEGGRVRIWSHSDAAEHHLIVDDDGPGIPQEQRLQVLDRFYRVEGTASDKGRVPGAGLGLAIADWALRANHGRIRIDAADRGGTRMDLSLPRADGNTRA